VNPNGSAVEVHFQWGLTTNYGSVTTSIFPGSGSSTLGFSAALPGLIPGTNYHFRFTATNAFGWGWGADQTFTTVSTNANLSSLTVSIGTLTPAFNPGTNSYSLAVSNIVSSITLTSVVADATATISNRINGGPFTALASGVASGPVALNVGDTVIEVKVTAQDPSSTKSYFMTVNRAAILPSPEIAVEQPLNTNIADGDGQSFGNVNVGANTSLTFTIKNTGGADLTGLGIVVDGTDAPMFTVTTNPTAPVSGPNGSTTFTVRFAPNSAGTKTAALHIANNDTDESPFDLTLTGMGVCVTVICPPLIVTNYICNDVFVPQQYPMIVSNSCPSVQVQVNCNPPPGTPLGVGVHPINCVVTAGGTVVAQCNFVILVIRDSTPPVISCPDDISVTGCVSPLGGCGAVVNYPAPVTSDNSGIMAVNCVPPSGSFFPCGITTVTCTAVDHCLAEAACQFTITVLEPPPITLVQRARLPNGDFQFAFSNTNCATFTVLATTNMALPLSNWTVLGSVPEISPGQFQFTDPQATNSAQRFYRVRSP